MQPQTQKFNPTEPHGTVYNHPTAAYEQNGILFDQSGDPLPGRSVSVESKPASNELEDKDEEGTAEMKFLRRTLRSGPLSQSIIKRDAVIAGLNWAEVQLAAAELGVEKSRVANVPTWALPEIA